MSNIFYSRFIKWTGIALISISAIALSLVLLLKQITISNINSKAQALKESKHHCNYALVQQGYKTIDPMLLAAITMQDSFLVFDTTIDLEKWEYSPISNRKFDLDKVFKYKDFTLDNLCNDKQSPSLTNKIVYDKARNSDSITIVLGSRTIVTDFFKFNTINFLPDTSIGIKDLRSEDIDILSVCKTLSHQGDIKASRALLLNNLSNCDMESPKNKLLQKTNKSSQDMILLGDIYLKDSNAGTRDTGTAIKWFLRASASGTPKTQYQAAIRLIDDMPSTAIYILKLSAINGFELSAYHLSKISKDAKQSYFWSLNRIFLCLQDNKNCDKPKKDALKYSIKIDKFKKMKIERAALNWQKNKLKETQEIKDKINSSLKSTNKNIISF